MFQAEVDSAILVRLIELIIDGLGANTISTKRDLYYKDVALFGKQSVVDQVCPLSAVIISAHIH